MSNEKKIEIPAMPEKYRIMLEMLPDEPAGSKEEQDAEKTPDPTANPAEGIDWEGMRKFRAKDAESGKCRRELQDAECEWCNLIPELVNSDDEKEAWARLVTADERMRRTRSQLRRMAKIAMGYIAE